MNIGPMLRALLGEGQPAEGSRALELRIGQIVRGVLMEMLENGEALVNINGVHVRAKLDAEMPLGRGTLLQVQASSSSGVVTLKPLADVTEYVPDDGMKDILKQFGLPDQKWSIELMRGLKRDGYPIGRETAQYFASAAALKPPNVDAQSWTGATDVAFRRGLTATEATIHSLRQALYGAPLHESVEQLQSALAAWQSSGKAAPDSSALGMKLQSLLSQGAELLSRAVSDAGVATGLKNGSLEAATVPDTGSPKPAAASTTGSPATLATASRTETALPSTPNMASSTLEWNRSAANPSSMDGTPEEATPSAPGRAVSTTAPSNANGERPMAPQSQAAGNVPAQNDIAAAERQLSASANAMVNANANTSKTADSASAGAGTLPSETPEPRLEWVGRFLQWLGADHEHRTLVAGLKREAEPVLPAAALGIPTADGEAPSPIAARTEPESLKSMLLQLASQSDIPSALREAAQTLVNHITGQQLLLSSERNTNAPFSHMTLFVPMRTTDGETTATVHVQTRRGRKGEWDADNCRLLFDLRMRSMGDTIVDVQVVDRIVSVKLMNDFPGMQNLLDQARGELANGMRDAGFQLLSLSVAPLPQLRAGNETTPEASRAGTDRLDHHSISSAYASKPYKGVDYRA